MSEKIEVRIDGVSAFVHTFLQGVRKGLFVQVFG